MKPDGESQYQSHGGGGGDGGTQIEGLTWPDQSVKIGSRKSS
jgi:hypothetical protein